MKKRELFNRILKDIKNIKIQGATNVAKAALRAYYLFPEEKNKIISVRPTEPLLFNVLEQAKTKSYSEILKHFKIVQEKINKYVYKLIKNGDVIMTHCHSSTVVNALIYAKKKGKKFEVYNTETRPLFQGRLTAKELRKAGIKVTQFVDSAIDIALLKEQGTKKVNKVFIGSDAILKKGIINKVGSAVIAKLSKKYKIPFYVVADSWKFFPKPIKLEKRTGNEIWKNRPFGIKIINPAFEFVHKKYITALISELGILNFKDFLKKVN